QQAVDDSLRRLNTDYIDLYFSHWPDSSIFDMITFRLMWFVFSANTPEHQTLFQSGWFVVVLIYAVAITNSLAEQVAHRTPMT
ncbi:aldo/keto reductase, partial [Klebsiella pneumoniae]